MELSRYIRLARSWRDLLHELLWKFSPDLGASEELSFPLDPDTLKQVQIRWPTVYEWPIARHYVEHLRTGLARFVKVEPSDLSQPYGGIVLIQMILGDTSYDIVIDYSDYLDRINSEALKRCALYFKMQYYGKGYDPQKFATEKIIPGGYINGNLQVYKYIPHIRPLGDQGTAHFDVYGRFGLEFAKEIRQKAVLLLNEQTEFHYEGGLKKVRYSQSLMEIAQSKICIDLPSNSDFCFRLIDYFAVGACVIAPRHRTIMPVPLEDRKHIVYTHADLSDLVPLCQYYLEHTEEREKIRKNSREYFDCYLHREQLAAYYLSQCINRLIQ